MSGSRSAVRFLSGILVLAAVACGGGAPTAPGPPTGSTQTFTGSVALYAITSHAHTVAQAGTLTVTLTWTAQADLDLYVTASACTGYPPDACVILARSTASSGQREEVTLPVTAGAALKLWAKDLPAGAADPTCPCAGDAASAAATGPAADDADRGDAAGSVITWRWYHPVTVARVLAGRWTAPFDSL